MLAEKEEEILILKMERDEWKAQATEFESDIIVKEHINDFKFGKIIKILIFLIEFKI